MTGAGIGIIDLLMKVFVDITLGLRWIRRIYNIRYNHADLLLIFNFLGNQIIFQQELINTERRFTLIRYEFINLTIYTRKIIIFIK